MKRKFFGVVLFFALFIGLISTTHAQVDFINCNVLKTVVTSMDEVRLQTVNSKGERVNYTCAGRIRINGRTYRYPDEIISAIPAGAFGKAAVEDGVVNVLNFSTESKTYNDVTYNSKKGIFNIPDVKNSGLPVYYRYKDDFYPAYLDGKHCYDIEVYDYGILITDMKSKTMPEDIKLIEINPGIDSEFLQYIGVYLETTAERDYQIKGELYNDKMKLIGKAEGSSSEGDLAFSGLENRSAEYTVKLWLEDNGTHVSDIYTLECVASGFDTPSGYITQKKIIFPSYADSEIIRIRTIDVNGEEKNYNCAARVYVNGKGYRTPEELEAVIKTDVFAKMAVVNGEITRISFGEDCSRYSDMTYSEETKYFDVRFPHELGLPIYYRYNESYYPAYLSEDHHYDIEVYDYGILITEMKSKAMPEDIKLIEIGTGIDGEFLQYVNVYCETTATENCLIKGEIYDAENKLIAEQQMPCSDTGDLQFTGLENCYAEYTVKLWLEDNGTVISDIYTLECVASGFDTPSGYITQKKIIFPSYADSEIIRIRTIDVNGEEKNYNCAARVYVNGKIYRTPEELEAVIKTNVFAKMAVVNGEITRISFGENFNEYKNVTYNEVTKSFEGLSGREAVLPIFYQYNNNFYLAYPDENHYYDIEVHEYGILITDMKSKTMPEDIKLIEIGTGIDGEFLQYVSVYCETTSTDSIVLKGELYNSRHKKLGKSHSVCSGNGEILFKLPVSAGTPAGITLWLENENGKRISDTYTLGTGKKEKKIVFGDIVMSYIGGEEGEEKTYISVKDVNGSEEHYVCDTDVIVLNDMSYYSLRSTVNIPENTFAKIGVEDGFAKVIKFGSDAMEMSVTDFMVSENQPEGSICIMNNTPDSVLFDCYAAIYGESGELKGVNVIPGAVESEGYSYVNPVFESYRYSDGDYVRVFLWEASEISPLLEPVGAEIRNE